MQSAEEMIAAYRQGGAQERMDAYLANPWLRTRLDEIEREEERGSMRGKAATGEGRLGRPCCPLARWWPGQT